VVVALEGYQLMEQQVLLILVEVAAVEVMEYILADLVAQVLLY
jgi:hypothetical protein